MTQNEIFLPHILIATIALTSCNLNRVTAEKSAPKKAPVVQVIADKIVPSELSDTLSYPAMVAPNSTTEVSAETEGVVTSIQVELGRFVKKGSALLTIENSDPIYHYAPFSLKAPISGVITTIDASRGGRIVRGKSLVTITDISRPKFKIEVTARDLPKLKVGEIGQFHADALELTLKLSALSPVIDPARGTAPGELEPLDKLTQAPISGTIGKVSFAVNKHLAMTVPEQAVYYRGKDPYVMLVGADNKVTFVDIVIINKFNDVFEVESNLKAGDRVVTRASGFIAEGDAVILQNAEVTIR